MSAIELPAEAEIQASAETIFELIIDFDGQERWLGRSVAFRGTRPVSPHPVALGTTYVEPGPLGVRTGEVTEFERPARITFHQPMRLRFGVGTIDIVLRYALSAGERSTHVRRTVTIQVPAHLRPLTPVLVRAFRTESTRTLMALKAYADRGAE
jgi:uncharacterized protein YndB with AHSA1/START domain